MCGIIGKKFGKNIGKKNRNAILPQPRIYNNPEGLFFTVSSG